MTIFSDLISNVALLLALSILYSFLTRIWKQGEIPGQILAGILFGGVAVAGMMQPFNYAPGVIFDGRSMVVSMAGLFGGPVTAGISTLIAGGYRLGLGGTGALTGFGVIFTSAVLGVGYHYLRRKNPAVIKPLYLFVFGVIVHISMLLWMLTLPWPLAFEVLNKISMPVMLIFPLGTVFLGTLLVDQEERNYAQEALRESEAKYRTLLENLPQRLFFKDKTLTYVSCNENYAQDLQINPDDLAGKTDYDLYPKELAEKYRADDKRIIESEKTEEIQEKYVQDGEDFLVHTVKTPVLDEMGKVSGVLGIFWDITEQQQIEEALRESEENLRAILDNSPIAIWCFDGEEYSYLSGEWYRYTGQDPTLPTTVERWIELVHPDDLEKTGQIWEKHWKTKTPHDNDFRLRGADGKYRQIHCRAFPIFDRKGRFQYFQGFNFDVTEREEARGALLKSEEKYRLLIENATDAIFIIQDEVLKFANPKTEELIGYSAEELSKFPFVDHIHPEDRDVVLEGHLKRLKGEEIVRIYSFRIINKSREVLSVELNTVLIEWEGRPATLNFLRDITVQEKLEVQLQQAQKMEAIGTLSGGIAHDFNNLLMAIQGRTSIMLMKKDSSHPDIEHLKGIEDNIERAADLTKQLLGFARGGKYEVKATDLNELIKKHNRMFGRTKKEITIRGKYEENLWIVEVDQGQIEQVLLNLYVNAWQAMPGGGDLYLETENVTLDEIEVEPFSIEPGEFVKISVTDTGVGMDKATREKIFEPFFTTKEMGRGTGLGLASVYGIIKNHGGFIDAHSEKGHGSTFNIYLPASEKEVIEEKKPAGDTLRGTETVLFVDDEDMIIEVAGELFDQLGYKVLTAGSGREAIETYEKNKEKIDIVLLDMIMPDMSGGETYDSLKEVDPDIKVLLSSGYSLEGRATEILDRGCNGFIQKPFKMKELSRKLREILDDK